VPPNASTFILYDPHATNDIQYAFEYPAFPYSDAEGHIFPGKSHGAALIPLFNTEPEYVYYTATSEA
jgi:hypothetical protein